MVVAGAGIAGLSTALALHRVSHSSISSLPMGEEGSCTALPYQQAC